MELGRVYWGLTMANEKDIVLIYHEDQPTVFGRIETIEPDIKKGWYHVTLLLLTLPTQTVTWILRDAYIAGESFTMGGKSMRLEEVKATQKTKEALPKSEEDTASNKTGTVIPFKKPSP